ncbi:PREDICTED: probable phospholipid-transporting ATPase IA isoform X2 [Nicrophorus vespilloides]|uniref:Phospholipid-transporting ATPase n=1 Tax=Nicrophorus vespilloides TaxID=110193 RepID=A0ABM1NC80_NICVS|nr:PREDICTED: probable phospholipid-transporting ATPase IA isoform X2 [Nicrophorus vespilloides]XP_017784428.1 PREDICTED: probable phospholipid-transporting ATPase IA isoform X2 [Nicrophorus vespilloides]XP_017784429.1 PREDICTED: probable phospholipid-transporting ATPase IA isoform X2 [Nicrophorus vespilloides]XP_017784430.1 PREDICTED: probable phospholipid-transporting ATPase IA isoform X2 [Nicrophorus vespilloides]
MNFYNNLYQVLRARLSVTGHEDDGTGSSPLDRTTEHRDPTSEPRVVFINRVQPPITKFVNNRISTAKYSILRFAPLFLFEQFRRWANVFFLMIALLQQIPDVSPTGRYTTLVPLIFILSVSAIKEIIEDIKRHRADDETNHREVYVLRSDAWKKVKWMHVGVGDIVKVLNNNFFPADLVLISSSEPQGMSFIETANLDGETNLKIRQALPSTATLTSIQPLTKLIGSVECEPPNRHLYEFTGVLHEHDRTSFPLGPDQILLRGAMLRNTSWVFGIVIYTGHETKLMRNSTKAPLKRSSVDKLTNVQILLLFGILLVMCLICSICNEIWSNAHASTDWYIALEAIPQNFAYNLLTFVILFNNLIPISLQVTLEVVRFIQAIFINMDREMYYPETDTPAMARTSNLNEELGQVKYIFSDKTGTLTRNVMEFKRCAVGNEVYTLSESQDTESLLVNVRINNCFECCIQDSHLQHILNDHANADLLRDLLILLSVCHTVIPEKMPDGSIVYHAASPDERALVYGASKFGYVFESRTPSYVEISAFGIIERFEILHVLEFTSTRKRMSVIVRDPSGNLRLLCKGADTMIYERLNNDSSQHKEVLLQHLEQFATEGLRTLCCAVAELDESEYERWRVIYHNAACSMINREKNVEAAEELLEKNLKLIGATAIEDKLQEGVPEAIATLLKADINVWVLTGDKQETAINIGYSCRLIVQGMPLIILNEDSLDSARETILRHHSELGDDLEKQNNIALIVDGKTLKYSLSCDLRTDFLKLCISCKVVICCRVSPLQKAEVVEYITKYTKTVTLAIGDGANDVAMIQKAHVGVGISGVEGLQAACASDYSIAQFRFLLRLLLVHGAWNYSRMCKLILYSFYKNICLYVIELWFAYYSGWSGQILFERWSIGLYNVIFTAMPPLAMGLFDKACSADMMILNPKLYKPSQNGQLFNVKVFWLWVCNGLFHSAILFWLPLFICQNDIIWASGQGGGYLVLGNIVYTVVVVTVCIKAGIVTNSWVWPTHCAIWGSIALWFVFIIVYSNFWPTLPIGSVMAGMYIALFTSAIFWLCFILIPIMAIIPDFAFKVIWGTVRKSLTEKAREEEIKNQDPTDLSRDSKTSQQLESPSRLSETARLLKKVHNVFSRRPHTRVENVEMSHGFAFSQEEGGSVSQAEMIRAYDTNIPKPKGI